MRSLLSLAIFALIALPLAGSEVGSSPAPSWVERLPVDTSRPVPREIVRWGLYDLLVDHQTRVSDEEWRYARTVRKVLSPSGVQNASELTFEFDPSFERLVLHEVSLIRGNVRKNALEPEGIRVIDTEDEAGSGIYDGRRTAIVFLADVRAGDVIDWSWSVIGANPILEGRFTAELDLSVAVPAGRLRHRLLWPLGRPVEWRGSDPEITTHGDIQSLVWERLDVEAIVLEDATPSWYQPWESVEVSDFSSWREVGEWAQRLFALDERSGREVSALAKRFRSENETIPLAIAAAIRFVQDDIRYLGIEMGRNSHEPRQPWQTLERRWGDCKDKSLLLAALLREMGLRAWPALVQTRLRDTIDEKLPSPFLFDHVITQVVDGNRTYWVDPTLAAQGGMLDTIETPNDGSALVVRPGVAALERVITNMRGRTVVEQVYRTSRFDAPVVLEMRTTWTGHEADAMRADLADLSVEDLAAERLNELAQDQPRIEPLADPSIVDDRNRNILTLTERYRIRQLWSGGEWTWMPRLLESYLTRPETMIRSMPLALPWPLDVEQRVSFVFPVELEVPAARSVVATNALRFATVTDSNGSSVNVRQTLRVKRAEVTADEVPDHLEKLGTIASQLGFRIAPEGAGGQASAKPEGPMRWVVGIAAALAIAIAAALLAARRGPKRSPASSALDLERESDSAA